MALDARLSHLPRGVAQYTREGAAWGVAIFAHGTAERLYTIACGVDKGVASWLAEKLNEIIGTMPLKTRDFDTLDQNLTGIPVYHRGTDREKVWPKPEGR